MSLGIIKKNKKMKRIRVFSDSRV